MLESSSIRKLFLIRVLPEELACNCEFDVVLLDFGDNKVSPKCVVEAATGLNAIERNADIGFVVGGWSMLEDVRHG